MCVLVQLFLIQTLPSTQFYIKKKVISPSIQCYNYFVCRVNRFRVMMDFLRDGPAYRVLCMFQTFHMSCAK